MILLNSTVDQQVILHFPAIESPGSEVSRDTSIVPCFGRNQPHRSKGYKKQTEVINHQAMHFDVSTIYPWQKNSREVSQEDDVIVFVLVLLSSRRGGGCTIGVGRGFSNRCSGFNWIKFVRHCSGHTRSKRMHEWRKCERIQKSEVV